MKSCTTRRRFLASAGAALTAGAAWTAGAAESRTTGANEKISIGMIGVGGRGTALLNEIIGLRESQNVEVTAVCDVWRKRLPQSVRMRDDVVAQANVPVNIGFLLTRTHVDISARAPSTSFEL